MDNFTIQTIHGQRVLSDNDRRNTLPANTDEQEKESREFLKRLYLYNLVKFIHESVTIEVATWKKDDHEKQAKFVIDMMESILPSITSEADDIVIQYIKNKFGI